MKDCSDLAPHTGLPTALPASPPKRTAILVLGMHRSGTSALTRVLSLLGAALPKNVLGPGPGNETGHWEPIRLVEYHDKLLTELDSSWDDWRALDLSRLSIKRQDEIKAEIADIVEAEYGDASLFVVKDPRICRFAPLFVEALSRIGIESKPILVLRNPLEVSASLAARTDLWTPHRSPIYGHLLWLRHALAAEISSRGLHRSITSYDGLLRGWRTTIDRITGQTAIDWPYTPRDVEEAVDHYLASHYRHHTHTPEGLLLDPALRTWTSEAYHALEVLQRNATSNTAFATLDRIRLEFDRMEPLLHRLLEDAHSAIEATREEAAEHEKALRSRIDETSSRAIETQTLLEKAVTAAEAQNAKLALELARADARAEDTKKMLEDALTAAHAQNAARTEILSAELERLQTCIGEAAAANQEERAQLEARLNTLQAELAEAEERIRAAKAANLELQAGAAASNRELRAAFEGSTSWKLTSPIRAVKLAPRTLRRLKGTATTAMHIGGGLWPTIRKTIKIYRLEGVAGIRRRYRFSAAVGSSGAPNPKSRRTGANTPAAQSPAQTPAPSASQFPLAEIKRSMLEKQQDLALRCAMWANGSAKKPISAHEFLDRLRKTAPERRKIVISITHDDYRKIVGGVQLCTQLEERQFSHNGHLYLNLHPSQPLPMLSHVIEADQYTFQAVANGETLGDVTAATLIEALQRYLGEGDPPVSVVHSLLGHSPEVISLLLRELNSHRSLFWVHDYFAACPNHLLLRNDVSFCHGPSPKSVSCVVCSYGTVRRHHASRIERLFRDVSFDVVAPSDYALALWKKAAILPHGKAMVAPHSTLSLERTLAPSTAQTQRVRIAYLGHPVFHKGWPVFAHLAKLLAEDARYEFWHLGQQSVSAPTIRFRRVRTSAANPEAMTQALVAANIDVVLLWPAWPETYSFTYHEAIAAGAFALTNPQSGNIQAQVTEAGTGRVVENEDDLLTLLRGKAITETIYERRAAGRTLSNVTFSKMSGAFLH